MQLCPGRAAGCELTVVWGDAHPHACAGPQLQRGCATLGVCWALCWNSSTQDNSKAQITACAVMATKAGTRIILYQIGHLCQC